MVVSSEMEYENNINNYEPFFEDLNNNITELKLGRSLYEEIVEIEPLFFAVDKKVANLESILDFCDGKPLDAGNNKTVNLNFTNILHQFYKEFNINSVSQVNNPKNIFTINYLKNINTISNSYQVYYYISDVIVKNMYTISLLVLNYFKIYHKWKTKYKLEIINK